MRKEIGKSLAAQVLAVLREDVLDLLEVVDDPGGPIEVGLGVGRRPLFRIDVLQERVAVEELDGVDVGRAGLEAPEALDEDHGALGLVPPLLELRLALLALLHGLVGLVRLVHALVVLPVHQGDGDLEVANALP